MIIEIEQKAKAKAKESNQTYTKRKRDPAPHFNKSNRNANRLRQHRCRTSGELHPWAIYFEAPAKQAWRACDHFEVRKTLY